MIDHFNAIKNALLCGLDLSYPYSVSNKKFDSKIFLSSNRFGESIVCISISGIKMSNGNYDHRDLKYFNIEKIDDAVNYFIDNVITEKNHYFLKNESILYTFFNLKINTIDLDFKIRDKVIKLLKRIYKINKITKWKKKSISY